MFEKIETEELLLLKHTACDPKVRKLERVIKRYSSLEGNKNNKTMTNRLFLNCLPCGPSFNLDIGYMFFLSQNRNRHLFIHAHHMCVQGAGGFGESSLQQPPNLFGLYSPPTHLPTPHAPTSIPHALGFYLPPFNLFGLYLPPPNRFGLYT